VKKWQIPRFINTDKAPAYGRALALLKREGRCPSDVEHRQIKYRNNVIECDHGKLKRIIGATLGFKSMKTAYATIKGIEVMRALRKKPGLSILLFFMVIPGRNAPGKQS
jgi:IS6 family transposase